jgi:large-conductance mechanosensitive channel
VFSGLAALTNYELNGVLYTSSAPVSLFVYTILTTVLPFLLGAVISFVVAALSSQQEKLADEKETETQPKATEAAETQPTPEEDFKA